jgi:hypothetical protein
MVSALLLVRTAREAESALSLARTVLVRVEVHV